ncbi:MAG: hypothetical protein K2Q03_03430, partial [Sphingobacteriaceae bacterium]|nr:hypothetical protein [Sphingobacteriaceae bacterium]
ENKIAYHTLMQLIGLSEHPNHLARRRAKYPQHFSEVDGHWYVSLELATFLAECKTNELLALKLKGGN